MEVLDTSVCRRNRNGFKCEENNNKRTAVVDVDTLSLPHHPRLQVAFRRGGVVVVVLTFGRAAVVADVEGFVRVVTKRLALTCRRWKLADAMLLRACTARKCLV